MRVGHVGDAKPEELDVCVEIASEQVRHRRSNAEEQGGEADDGAHESAGAFGLIGGRDEHDDGRVLEGGAQGGCAEAGPTETCEGLPFRGDEEVDQIGASR